MTRIDGDADLDVTEGHIRRVSVPRRRHRVVIIVVVLVILPLLVLASAGAWFWWQLDPPGGEGSTVQVQVQQNWGVPQIADELSHKGVIGSALVFDVYARLKGETNFQAGTYFLRRRMGVRKAVSTLKKGPRIDYTNLAVPPGLWLKQIAPRVGKLPGRNGDAFLEDTRNNAVRSALQPESVTSLEGLLWPDTYKVSDSEDEIDILKIMVKTFDQNAVSTGLANANVHGYGAYDILKIASLIQQEAKLDTDRPLIASVIYNRLAANMPLQIDASLIYARGNPSQRTLSNADKQINSPYNTYLHAGLPPTPISSVSRASLLAALHPATTPYLYYFTGCDGKTRFATTYQEHQQNIATTKCP
jgi:peptidoglycan lytic transglycosylase G